VDAIRQNPVVLLLQNALANGLSQLFHCKQHVFINLWGKRHLGAQTGRKSI
jgi:hypothetical protein